MKGRKGHIKFRYVTLHKKCCQILAAMLAGSLVTGGADLHMTQVCLEATQTGDAKLNKQEMVL